VAGAIRRCQTIGYLVSTLLHGRYDGRPHKLHAEHDKADESDHLSDKRKINIHALLLPDY